MPGTDIGEALRIVMGELPAIPFLPELPARGPGADMIGRGAGVLVDLPVDLQPSGWRLIDRPGRDARRTADLVERDLDVMTEVVADHTGVFKLQVAGLWTLAANLELPRGEKVLADSGAMHDLTGSLAEGVRRYVADVRRRLPNATVLVQLDEPSLPQVLAGHVPTASGYSVLPALDVADARDGLAEVVAAADAPVVLHCCAPNLPLELARQCGAIAVSLDLSLPDLRSSKRLDVLGEELEAGLALWAGVVPSLDTGAGNAARNAAGNAAGGAARSSFGSGSASARAQSSREPSARERSARERSEDGTASPGLSDPAHILAGVRSIWRRLGLDPSRLAELVVVTPTCGLAGASPGYATAALGRCREAAAWLVKDPEG